MPLKTYFVLSVDGCVVLKRWSLGVFIHSAVAGGEINRIVIEASY